MDGHIGIYIDIRWHPTSAIIRLDDALYDFIVRTYLVRKVWNRLCKNVPSSFFVSPRVIRVLFSPFSAHRSCRTNRSARELGENVIRISQMAYARKEPEKMQSVNIMNIVANSRYLNSHVGYVFMFFFIFKI